MKSIPIVKPKMLVNLNHHHLFHHAREAIVFLYENKGPDVSQEPCEL